MTASVRFCNARNMVMEANQVDSLDIFAPAPSRPMSQTATLIAGLKGVSETLTSNCEACLERTFLRESRDPANKTARGNWDL